MSDIQNQTNEKRSTGRRTVFPLVVVLVFSAVTILYGGRIYNFVAARMFTPSAEVETIHDRIAFTGEGSDLFYSSKPVVESSEQFNASCNSSERTAAILGCYYQGEIHIYNVTNMELAQAKDVSAAHEMLHAAYERLNFIDRSSVDAMIEAEHLKLKNNAELAKLMEYYKQAEPNALTNELHSIIGTTVTHLSPQLESYYQRYFKSRQNVVSMNKAYNDVFTAVEQRADELSAKVDVMQPQVNADLASYGVQLKQLDADIGEFNTRAANGYYVTRSAFNIARQSLANRVTVLNEQRSDINARIVEYNEYIAELKRLSVRVGELNSSINGIAEPEAAL